MRTNNGSNNNYRIREVPAVRKAVAILNTLSKQSEPLGVTAISKKLGMVPSTCLHIMRVLVSEGLVTMDRETKRYSLDVGILSLARGLMTENELVKRLQPQFNRVSSEFNATLVAVKVIDIEHSVVIAVSHSQSTMRLNVEVGSRFPTLVSATGRCYAAFGGEAEIEIIQHFQRLRWSRPPSMSEWKQQVEETAARGYAIDAGNYISGHMVVTVPVLSHDIMKYGVSAVGEAGIIATNQEVLAHKLSEIVNNTNF